MITGSGDERRLNALLLDVRAGAEPAFARLWEELSPVVAGYLRGRGVRAVDEVTNAVFLAAFRGITTFEGDGAAFRRRLFTIARHRSVDVLRHQPRTPDPSATGEPQAALLLLPGVPADQRDVLLLRLVGGLSVDEVAQVLDRPPETVRQLHRRAQARLRELATDPDAVTALRRLAGSAPKPGPDLAVFLGEGDRPRLAPVGPTGEEAGFMDTASLVRPPRPMTRYRPSGRRPLWLQAWLALRSAATTLAQAGFGTRTAVVVGLTAVGVAVAGLVSGGSPLPQLPVAPEWSSTVTPGAATPSSSRPAVPTTGPSAGPTRRADRSG